MLDPGIVWTSTGDLLNAISQATFPKIEFTEEDLSAFSERFKA
jgi:hypothetical protein